MRAVLSTANVRARTSVLLIAMLSAASANAAESTPQATVSALWRAISHEAGASADVATLRRLFHDEAVIFGGQYRSDVPTFRRSSAADFIESSARVGEQAFHECEVARTLHVYDRFATAYSVVESRKDADAAAPDFVGVNSVQLYREGSQWKVVSLYYHVEKPGDPVSLDGGTSGRCID